MQPATTYAAVVGQVIKSLRSSKNMSQGDLATKLGITQATLSRIESGSVGLPMAGMAQLAGCLDTKPAEFVRAVDAVSDQLKSQGVAVEYAEPDSSTTDMIMIGTAAIAAIALGIWLNRGE